MWKFAECADTPACRPSFPLRLASLVSEVFATELAEPMAMCAIYVDQEVLEIPPELMVGGASGDARAMGDLDSDDPDVLVIFKRASDLEGLLDAGRASFPGASVTVGECARHYDRLCGGGGEGGRVWMYEEVAPGQLVAAFDDPER